jgi:hypothetical protein
MGYQPIHNSQLTINFPAMPCGQLRFEPAYAGGNLVSEDIALPVGYYIPSAYSGPRSKKRWLNDRKPKSRTWQGTLILTYSVPVDKLP